MSLREPCFCAQFVMRRFLHPLLWSYACWDGSRQLEQNRIHTLNHSVSVSPLALWTALCKHFSRPTEQSQKKCGSLQGVAPKTAAAFENMIDSWKFRDFLTSLALTHEDYDSQGDAKSACFGNWMNTYHPPPQSTQLNGINALHD